MKPRPRCYPQLALRHLKSKMWYTTAALLGLTASTSTALPMRSAAESRKLLDRIVVLYFEEKGQTLFVAKRARRETKGASYAKIATRSN